MQIGKQNFPPVKASNKKDSETKAAEAAIVLLQQSGRISASNLADVSRIRN